MQSTGITMAINMNFITVVKYQTELWGRYLSIIILMILSNTFLKR